MRIAVMLWPLLAPDGEGHLERHALSPSMLLQSQRLGLLILVGSHLMTQWLSAFSNQYFPSPCYLHPYSGQGWCSGLRHQCTKVGCHNDLFTHKSMLNTSHNHKLPSFVVFVLTMWNHTTQNRNLNNRGPHHSAVPWRWAITTSAKDRSTVVPQLCSHQKQTVLMRFSNIFLWTMVYFFLAREAACKKGWNWYMQDLESKCTWVARRGCAKPNMFSPPPKKNSFGICKKEMA